MPPLQKFPVEVPLAGPVDEGNVPEVVQPPLIREARDCASLKGGAYRKRDGNLPPEQVVDDAYAVQHRDDTTVAFGPTTVTSYPDDGSAPSSGYPSPATGRQTTAFSPTESDAVKQHGDHATLELPSGVQRSLCAWNVDPRGDYRVEQDTPDLPAGYPPYPSDENIFIAFEDTPPPTVPPEAWSWYDSLGARYAVFDGDIQKGPERPYPRNPEDFTADGFPRLLNTVPTFPRVRADQDNQLFWSVLTLPPSTDGSALLSYRPDANSVDILDSRDMLAASLATGAANIRTPGCLICVHNVDGEILAVRASRPYAGDPEQAPMAAPLDVLFIAGASGGLYTMHQCPRVPVVGPATTVPRRVEVYKWQFDAGTSTIIPDPGFAPWLTDNYQPLPEGNPGIWPAGLHVLGNEPPPSFARRLMVLFSNTSRIYADSISGAPTGSSPPVPLPTSQVAGVVVPGYGTNAAETGQLLMGSTAVDVPLTRELAGSFSRMSAASYFSSGAGVPASTSTFYMTRGIWPGSFCAEGEPVGIQRRFWVGNQMISPRIKVDFANLIDEPYALPFSGCIHHFVLNELGGLVTPAVPTVGVIPGAVIGSRGAAIPGVGPSVVVYACAPGDNRSALAQNSPETFADVLTSTALLISRREIPELEDLEFPVSTGAVFGSDQFSVSNQAIAVLQVQPGSQAIGTYNINPYQVRTHMSVRSDGSIGVMAFERSAVENFTPDATQNAPEQVTRVSGGASRARPYLYRFDPNVDTRTVGAADYGLIDGSLPVAVGGPQGLASGWGPQGMIDRPRILPGGFSPIGLTLPEEIQSGGPVNGAPPEPGNFIALGSHAVSYDEAGGEHRTVPLSASPAYPIYQKYALPPVIPGTAPGPARTLRCYFYPVPYALLGLPNNQFANIEVYCSGPDDDSSPLQVGLLRMFPAGTDLWQTGSTTVTTTEPAVYLQTFAGSSQILYTSAGELAADAPDPSRALAAANSRVWSISSVNPRTAQYTKLLRRGYAPEWNGNLSVRVSASADELRAIAVLPDGRVLLFTANATYYTYGEGPSDTGQGAGFAEPNLLTDSVGCDNKRSIVVGDFGCIFRGERGFYRVDRSLSMTFIGLPYEDTTAAGTVLSTATDDLRSEAIFYTGNVYAGDPGDPPGSERWVYNWLRDQWSTFLDVPFTIDATERDGRPLALGASPVTPQRILSAPSEIAAGVTNLFGTVEAGRMVLQSGWLAMGRIQGFGRVWEVQIAGAQDAASTSGLQIEISYDYVDTTVETFTYDTPATAERIHIRLRPARQKCESISIRATEYVPAGADPATCTGWQIDMLTLLCGVKVGIDKLAVTP